MYLKNISLSSKVAYLRVTGVNFIQVQCKSIQSIIKPIRYIICTQKRELIREKISEIKKISENPKGQSLTGNANKGLF